MQDKFNLRFPDGMREQIADAAKESGRSMNSEIIHRLQRTFDLDDPSKRTFKRKEKVELRDASELSNEEKSEFNLIMAQLMELMSKSQQREKSEGNPEND